MSQFIDRQNSQYIYQRDGNQYIIASGMLNSLFKSHGFCVDPGSRSAIPLTSEAIENLKTLAKNDQSLITTINSLSKNKAPSPKMKNDPIMTETTINEKHRFFNLTDNDKRQIISILHTILHIGLYLGGWQGDKDPYITSQKSIFDMVRVELKITPLIQSLYTDSNYPLIKNFPVMLYYDGGSSSAYSAKPSVVSDSLNIDNCLNKISSGLIFSSGENYQQMSSYLISTSYYYITIICNRPLPMLESLIISLTQKY